MNANESISHMSFRCHSFETERKSNLASPTASAMLPGHNFSFRDIDLKHFKTNCFRELPQRCFLWSRFGDNSTIMFLKVANVAITYLDTRHRLYFGVSFPSSLFGTFCYPMIPKEFLRLRSLLTLFRQFWQRTSGRLLSRSFLVENRLGFEFVSTSPP